MSEHLKTDCGSQHKSKCSDPAGQSEIVQDPTKFTFKCPVCFIIYDSVDLMSEHLKTVCHADKRHCSIPFKNSEIIPAEKSETVQDSTKNTFKCPVCFNVYDSVDAMSAHLKTEHKSLRNDKSQCSHPLPKSKKVNASHLLSGRGLKKKRIPKTVSKCPNSNAELTFKCPACGATYDSVDKMSEHLKIEHNSLKNGCLNETDNQNPTPLPIKKFKQTITIILQNSQF
jgi:rubredoxin